MDSSHRGWQSAANPHSNSEQGQQQASRAGASFGPGSSQHSAQRSPPSGPSGLPPPGAPFSPYHQPSHSLASLAGINQSSPRQPPPQTHRPDGPPSQNFSLPGISQATSGQSSIIDREREQIHIKEEEDRRHREQERHRLDQAPQHPPPSSVHLHQPVAVGPRSVHGPNGLLGNPGMAGPSAQGQMPLGAPLGPTAVFAGGPVQPPPAPGGQPMQAGMVVSYGPPTQSNQQPLPPPMAQQGQGQGQQPILNDALSYLDQVKVQFADHPDVYNRFLDIMKDFKSGAIDTPGVIGRVSTLFAGNPDLIQGFNTFLPPGYRIECGAGDDPNAIRVTTPMGTTVSSMPQPRPLSRQDGSDVLRPGSRTFTPQPGLQSTQMIFSPSGRPLGPAASGQPVHITSLDPSARQQELQSMHQQEQRGVNSLQSAAAAAGTGGIRPGLSPRATPMPAQEIGGALTDASGGQNIEKRGPVEFNHAISYVNKIKTRFASQPDIYKQFLEILQTYQRESKPIQDVYSQVTTLFKTAPDLLEDFKQFLPESAAQAKAAERARQQAEESIILSNVRAEGGGGMYASPIMSREAQMNTPGHARSGLPPVGNFAPTPASKDNKRKRGDRQSTIGSGPDGLAVSNAKAPYAGQSGKRMKQTHPIAKGPNDQPPPSPTLIPQLPAPIEPTTTSAATSEELGFFDKVKKAIGNKNVMNEFLKLCNLFSQDLIDRSTLVYRARSFIGNSPEIMKWFQDWIGYDETDILIENKPRIPTGRVTLSNCRGLGPSYRLLPKRERHKPCSGRDELCNSVLNDEWASHPTWASEDSGFIAHRKNVHEEGLHRIEEERHDYDFNIETCSRTVQLLEPIATQLRRMDEVSQRNYKLPPGLGGQSETIYKRVITKIYGREKGHEVIASLEDRPYQVIPILLNRLKERLETWKMAQREWEKVWREQTQKMFWKSLDHQAVLLKSNDRRQFQLKTLQNEIQVKYEEMKRANNANPGVLRQPQMEFSIEDSEVLLDATYLVLTHVEQSMSTDNPRLFAFIRDFTPLFFGLDADAFKKVIEERLERASPSDAAEDPPSGSEDSSTTKLRKVAAKNGGLLRAALEKGRKSRKDREDSNASGSRASTPEVAGNGDDDMAIDGPEESEARQEVGSGRWLDHPIQGNLLGSKNVDPLEPHHRDIFRCWANTPIYCFIRLFVMLYERLYRLKMSESDVRKTVKLAKLAKPAIELGIIDKIPQDFFIDTDDSANYYEQMLNKFEEALRGNEEFSDVEETLRRFYLQSGYPLYAFEKIVGTIARNASQIINSDSKEKSADMYQLFRKDRVKEVTTAQQQTDYRKAVEKMAKDAELYRIEFDQLQNKVKIFLSKKDDPITDDGLAAMDQETRWRYYVASYTSVENTDGVDINSVSYPFLMSNMRVFGCPDPRANDSFPPQVDEEHKAAAVVKNRFLDSKNEERLNVRIAVNNYRAFFQADTHESWHALVRDRTGGKDGVEGAEELRASRAEVMRDGFLKGHAAVRELSAEEVEERDAEFEALVGNGGRRRVEGEGEGMEVD